MQQGLGGPADRSSPGEHDDLRKAAESALRKGRTWGEVAVTVADRNLMPPTRETMKFGAKTVKAVAKWILN